MGSSEGRWNVSRRGTASTARCDTIVRRPGSLPTISTTENDLGTTRGITQFPREEERGVPDWCVLWGDDKNEMFQSNALPKRSFPPIVFRIFCAKILAPTIEFENHVGANRQNMKGPTPADKA